VGKSLTRGVGSSCEVRGDALGGFVRMGGGTVGRNMASWRTT